VPTNHAKDNAQNTPNPLVSAKLMHLTEITLTAMHDVIGRLWRLSPRLPKASSEESC